MKRNKLLGSTFVELIIGFSIIAILFAVSVSVWHAFYSNEKNKILENKIVQALMFARQQASLHNTPIIISNISDDWTRGFKIFLDTHGDANVYDPKQIIRIEHFTNIKGQLHWRSFSHQAYIRFAKASFESNNGSFWFCSQGKKQADWVLMINKSGRIRKSLELNKFSCA